MSKILEAVDLSLIKSDDNRKYTKDGDFEQLVNSIREQGIIEPPVVRKLPAPEKGYKAVAGRRRIAALRQLNKAKGGVHTIMVDCVVLDHDDPASDEEIALSENVNRLEMHPLDEAAVFKRMADDGKSVEDIAERYARSPSSIYKRLRLAGLTEDLKGMFRDGKLGIGDAAVLAELPEEDQADFFKQYGNFVLEDHETMRLTVREFFQKKQRFTIPAWMNEGCGGCAKRTHNQGNDLFDEYRHLDDVCLDGDCYRRKWREGIEAALAEKHAKLGTPPTDNKIIFFGSIAGLLYGKLKHVELFFNDEDARLMEVLREKDYEFTGETARKKDACWEIHTGYSGRIVVKRVGYKQKLPRVKQSAADKSDRNEPYQIRALGRENIEAAAAELNVPVKKVEEKLPSAGLINELVAERIITKRIEDEQSGKEPPLDYFSLYLLGLVKDSFGRDGLQDKGMDALWKKRLKDLTGKESLKQIALSLTDEAQKLFHYLLLTTEAVESVPDLDDLKDGKSLSDNLFFAYAGMEKETYRELYSQTVKEAVTAALKKKSGGKKKTKAEPGVRTCRVCGCTQDNCSQCIEKTGEPCHWVEEDLCSACAEEAGDAFEDDPDMEMDE